MRAGKGRDASRKGFTLIEMLIAILITALLAGIVGSAIRLAIRSVVAGEKKTELFERFKTALNAIDAQVEAEIPMLYSSEESARRFYFTGDPFHASFASNYSIWRGSKGYVMVEYRIDEDTKGKRTLRAWEHVPGTASLQEVKLLEGLDEAYFQYFHRDGRAPGGMWVDQWTDTSSIPEKMRLRLALGRKRLSMVMSLRARGYVDWIVPEDTGKQ